MTSLERFKECSNFTECPLIYHFDVGAMYPNIILTNRLQPYSIVNDKFCGTCDFYDGPETKCRKNIKWLRRGDYFPPEMNEYNMIVNQLKTEKYFDDNGNFLRFEELKREVQDTKIKERLSIYSKKIYNRVRISKVVEEESTVCQRENPFYVNTVRSFRDKRYQYKSDLKKCKEDLSKTNDPSRIIELQSLSVIYDSLQLAHKCILNSFYGYVMRKGARWYSMEMAGIVCLIGAEIIQMARSVVENLGKPLELDTDGIWCIIPSSFPGRFVLNVKDSTSRSIFYPCVILNKMVHERFTNDVYMDLVDPSTKTYATRSENSIFFEVDGPYRAMILPSSSKEDKLIKKRYAVFNKDGSLAEIKGFEVKRRGELKLIKIFQSQIFSVFLEGCTIDECYKAVASVANQWLDVLYSKGACLEDSELFDLISENRNMRRSLDEYGSQKSTSISTAKKLAELLGDQMVKHKGLNCKYVICNRPAGLPVSERAIPCVIFQAEPAIRKHYLRKWLGDGKCITDIREALDWKYYLERFGNVVQKIITVPASMQNVQNYVPRIPHPDWLQKKLKNNERSSSCGKSDLIGAFHAASLKNAGPAASGQASADRTGIIEDKVAQPVCDIVRDAATKDKEKILDQYCKLNVNAAVGSKREHGSFMLDPRNYSTYQGWLSDIKKKWSLITKLRGSGELQKIDGVKYNMRENGLPFTSEVGAKGRSNSLLSTMRGQDNTLFGDQKRVFMTSSWNVIHIRETDSPGVLSMWIVVGDFLQEIKLNVKRIIYINCTTNDIESLALRDEVSVKRESHRLLSGTQVYNIYSLKMPEKFYRNNMMMFSSISNHPNIEGVYEDNVSLSTYALIKLGSVVKVKSNASYVQNTLFSSGIDIEDIENQSHLKNKKPIFPFNNVRFDIVYVFYMHLECGLFIGSCKSGSNIIEVLIYDPYIKGKVNTKNEAEYEAMYISLLKIPRYSYLDSNGCSRAQRNFVDYPAEAKFSIRYLESEEQVHEGAKEVFERLARGKCRPILLILQPSVEVSHMISRGLNFINKYPFMTLPLHNEYKKYQFLNWKDSVIRYMLIHYFDLNRSIQAKVEVSTLSDIPLCNIPHDYPIFVTDISFARRMKQANIIIEWSESASSRRNNASQNFSLYTSELKYPEVNIKGCYSTLCFELELQDLILAPLLGMGLNSDNKFLYGGNFVSAQKTVIGYDPRKPVNHSKSLHVEENATEVLYHRGRLINTDIPVIALDILKSIIMGWAEDVHRENLYSAVLLSNVHRWFTSSSSTMSTPALYHKIFIQMRHCFMNLITEIELLGGKTIYASFDKLVIATQNTSMSLCLSSVKQIIRSIRSNSMFGAITFNFVRYWRYLLWMDPYNYGGISVDLSSELDIPREERDYLSQDGSDNNKATPMLAEGGGENSITVNEKGYNCELDMFWCIAYCLCPKYRSIFVKCIGQFISMFKYGSGAPSKNETVNYLEQEAGEKSTFDAKTYINKNLKAMLIGIISDMPEKSESEQDKSGGRLEHEDSYVYQKVLMVTYICESLGLDQDLKRDIDHLKSDLFSLLGVSEFSCYGEFTNPFERIRMSNYFCLFCSETRTLDINIRHNCDPLRPEDSGGLVAVILNEEPVMQSLFSWKCKKCGCDYDIGQVEQEIIQVLKFDMLSWHLQDPVCERCKITKIEDLRETCSNCSGKVVSVLPLATYQRRFRALHNLSHSLNKLPILKEMTSRLMNYVG